MTGSALAFDEAAGARGRLARVCFGVGVISVVVTPLAVLVAPIPVRAQYLVLVAGSLLVGLPHGAVDWAALPLGRRGTIVSRDVALVGGLYLVCGAAYLLVWFVAPVVAAVGFLVLTWVHWGQGDRYVLRTLYGAEYVRDDLQAALVIAVRGGLPMVVPLVAFPATYRRVLETFVAPFRSDVGVSWLFGPECRLALGGGLLLVTLVALGRARVLACEGDKRAWRLDALETGGLWLFFLVVPPVLAIATYFVVWHSLRHVARVLLLDRPSREALSGGRWGRPTVRFAVAAVLPTLGALAILAGLWAVVPSSPGDLAGIAGLGLVCVALLTLPHVAVVTWLDRLAYGPAATRRG